MKMEQTECSEISAYKIQTPGNYPEENIQHFSFPWKIEAAVFSKLERLCYVVLCHRWQKLSIVSWSQNIWHVRTLTF